MALTASEKRRMIALRKKKAQRTISNAETRELRNLEKEDKQQPRANSRSDSQSSNNSTGSGATSSNESTTETTAKKVKKKKSKLDIAKAALSTRLNQFKSGKATKKQVEATIQDVVCVMSSKQIAKICKGYNFLPNPKK